MTAHSPPVLVGLDLDGTLIDPSVRHKQVLLDAASIIGVELDPGFEEYYYSAKSCGVAGREVLRQSGIVGYNEISRKWIELVEGSRYLELDTPYEGVVDELITMQSLGFSFCLCTSRQFAGRVALQIDRLGMARLFAEVVVCQIGVDGRLLQSKAELTKNLGLAAIVGDTEADYDWARELSVPFFPVTCGLRNADFWRAYNITAFRNTVLALREFAGKNRNNVM